MTELITIEQAAALDDFVLHHEFCHFMQTSLWGRVKKDWGWYGLICRDDSGKIVGTMAMLRHNVHYLNTCMLYAPRGPIFSDGDWATFEELVDAARDLAKQTGAYLLRLDPRIEENRTDFSEECKRLGFTQNMATDYTLFQPRMCYVLDLHGLTPETLESKYHRSTRYNVHLAQRRGIECVFGTPDDVPEFCRMMAQTAEKNEFTPRSGPYFRQLLTELGDHAKMYFAKQNGEIIAGTIAVTYGNRSWHMYGCSDNSRLADRPNEYLQWRMQSDAIEAGCDAFDFRGVEGYPVDDNPKIGLHKYKQGYGAEFHSYVGQFDLVLRPQMAKLVQLAAKLKTKR